MTQKALQWFRFYTDWLENPKLCNVSETFQARYVKLLCLRCKGEIPGITTEQIAWCLRLDITETEKTMAALEAAGLWADGDIYNWDNRQYNSDTSTDRVRKHRNKVKRFSNGDETLRVTPSESETETESEREREKKGSLSLFGNSSPATKKQIAFAGSCLKKHSLTVTQWQESTGREGRLTNEDVDVILAEYMEAPSKADKEANETKAKSAAFRQLKTLLDEVYTTSGAVKAQEFIRQQQPQFLAGLIVHLATIAGEKK